MRNLTLRKEKLTLLIAVMTIIGCGGNSDKVPPNPTPDPPPAPVTLPTWQNAPKADPGTVWHNGSSAISATSPNATSMKIIDSSSNLTLAQGTVSVSYNATELTQSRTYKIIAANAKGSIVANVTINVLSKKTTDLCSTGVWRMTKREKDGVEVSHECMPTQFFSDLTMKTFNSQCQNGLPDGNSEWRFVDNESKMYWAQYDSSAPYNIDTLTNQRIVRWRINPQGQLIRETFTH